VVNRRLLDYEKSDDEVQAGTFSWAGNWSRSRRVISWQ
jgi:hypothetical protein